MTAEEIERARRELPTLDREQTQRLFNETLRRGIKDLSREADSRLRDLNGNGGMWRRL